MIGVDSLWRTSIGQGWTMICLHLVRKWDRLVQPSDNFIFKIIYQLLKKKKMYVVNTNNEKCSKV